MANFSIRTLSYKRNGRTYKLHLKAEQKELEDFMDLLCEKLETSGVTSQTFGPFVMMARRDK